MKWKKNHLKNTNWSKSFVGDRTQSLKAFALQKPAAPRPTTSVVEDLSKTMVRQSTLRVRGYGAFINPNEWNQLDAVELGERKLAMVESLSLNGIRGIHYIDGCHYKIKKRRIVSVSFYMLYF